MCKQTENEQENSAQDLSFEQEQESLLQALWLKDVQQTDNQLSLFLLVVSNLGVISNVARCYHKLATSDREKDMMLNEAVGIFEDVCRTINRHDQDLCLLEEFLLQCVKVMSSDAQRSKRHTHYAEAREYGTISVVSAHSPLGDESGMELLDTFANLNQLSAYQEVYLSELPVCVAKMLDAVILEEDIRAMIRLHYIADMNIGQIAIMFGIDKQRVSGKISKAIRRLKIHGEQYISQ
jgi:DNA-directed RNA polymerase specialized sigma24 family protein